MFSSNHCLRILALEAYYGGSHQAFLDGWASRSRHAWTTLTLPAHSWKWRMRHAAATFSQEINRHVQDGQSWDVVFTSDMLNLAELRGMSPALANTPTALYFHENQLTYPNQEEQARDLHFAFTNLISASTAESVWFNSAFHREEFLNAFQDWLPRLPDFQPMHLVEQVASTSVVQSPGISPISRGERSTSGPLKILWAARWEHDKGPETFFTALRQLKSDGIEFRVSVLGEQFRNAPDVFADAKQEFADEIELWGFVPSRNEYEAALRDCDLFVSTALHEFFGIAAVEAMRAGAYPLLPDRLAYPELLQIEEYPHRRDSFLYDGSASDLATRLTKLAERHQGCELWRGDPNEISNALARFDWQRRVPVLDDAIADVAVCS